MSTAARRLLVVDDEAQIPKLARALLGPGWAIDHAASGEAALALLEDRLWDVILTDVEMGPGIDGVELLRRLRGFDPDTPVIVWTNGATHRVAVDAMHAGAFHFMSKADEMDRLTATVERAAEHGSLAREVRRLRDEVARAHGIHDVIGQSVVMQELLAVVGRVAPSDASVLILGESGTGKELIARTIHRMSDRRDGPFVAFDCSALAPGLLESELFGHERGAFTGAMRARRGLFREASGGTLFLDEIGDIAPEVQNKLLRVLQEREIKPVGAETFVKIDVRVLAATNKDLRALVQKGIFREDLYWRLAVVPLKIPPLRDRRDDLPLLCAHLLGRRRGSKKAPSRVTSDAIAKLAAYPWPGNIRELENVLARAAILSDGDEIRGADVPDLGGGGAHGGLDAAALAGPTGRPLKEIVSEAVAAVERHALLEALKECAGSPARVARLLGISRASVYVKLKQYGIEP